MDARVISRAPQQSKTLVSPPAPRDAFLNVPFDAAYEPLFITLISTVVCLGSKPHCVLEVREKGDGRLIRIVELMRSCPVSIHDLSRTGTPARFNMPFELGLACALKVAEPNAYEVVVLEAKPYRLDRTLSDYKGRDPLIHNGTCEGMLACLLDAFSSELGAHARLRDAARSLRRYAQEIKREMKIQSVFRPEPFRMLVTTATKLAIERDFITR